MTEIIDNAVQLAAMLACAVIAGVLAARRRKQALFILACYYGSSAMGLLYWMSYDVLTSYTPRIFYVADLCWVASYLFLLMLEVSMAAPEEKTFRFPAAWLSPAVSAAMTALYCQWGDYAENIVWCGIMGAAGWFAVRGWAWAARTGDTARRNLHIAVLLVIALEYGLWTASCFWVSDDLTNPYFWIDFALTAALAFALLPAAGKAVEA